MSAKKLLAQAMHEAYVTTDTNLVEQCRRRGGLDYASSTGVSALVAGGILTVAHLGDSKVVLGRSVTDLKARSGSGGSQLGVSSRRARFVAEYLTIDHKPNMAEELERIESMGGRLRELLSSMPNLTFSSLFLLGSLTYLHGGKPFIRGGDFTRRQQMGDRPMQLNYSRAFGGKDLKPYGLSNKPSIFQCALDPSMLVLILASDGLWDVCR